MKTRNNKAVSVLWQGVALVAILVSLLAVGFGASVAYAGAGGGAGGGSGAAGGDGGAAEGTGGASGGGNGSATGAGNSFSAEISSTLVAAGSTSTFALVVTNESNDMYWDWNDWNYTSCINLGKVTVLVPPEFTYIDDSLAAQSTNWSGGLWTSWHTHTYPWNTDDSGAPLLVAWTTNDNAELEVKSIFGSSIHRDYLVMTFDATAPDWCFPTGGDQFQDYEFTTSAYYWGKTGGTKKCPTYGWIEDQLGCGYTQPVVTVEAQACPEPTPTPEPEEEVLTPTLPLLRPEGAPMGTPVLVVDMQGTIARYPVTQDGVLLVDALTTSPDGLLKLLMLAGTQVLNPDGTPAYLNEDPDVFSTPAATPAAPAGYTMVAAYEFLPSGITFSPDATVIMKYNAEKIPSDGAPVIAYYDETAGQWIDLETAGYVAAGVEVPNTVQAHTAHLTYFAVLAK